MKRKLFWAQSHDLSIDKQNKNEKPLSNSTLSDFIKKMMIFDLHFRSGPARKILAYWQFPDLPIAFCDNQSKKTPDFHQSKQNIYSKPSFFHQVRCGGARRLFDESH